MADKNFILIVEDERLNAELFEHMLEELDYNTYWVQNGESALNIAKTKNPYLILLDIKLPTISGYETCRRLKNNHITENIPIIFISSLDSVENIVKAFDVGANDYIIKPFKKELVFARVKNQLKIQNKINELQLNNMQKDIENKELKRKLNNEDAKIFLAETKKFFFNNKEVKLERWGEDYDNDQSHVQITKPLMLNGEENRAITNFSIRYIKDIRKKISIENKLFRNILEKAIYGFFIIDKEGNFININKSFKEMLGYYKEDLFFKNINEIETEKASIKFTKYMEKIRSKESDCFKTIFKDKEGRLVNVEICLTYSECTIGDIYFAFVIDITERKKEKEKIEYLLFHDQLTGLFNRRYFNNKLDSISYSNKYPISIIIGDLNNLKFVNDNYGHKMGDHYIKKAAKIIKSNLRKNDIAARIGGDEFAIILTNTSYQTAQKICTRIINGFTEINNKEKFPEPLSIALGYSSANNNKESLKYSYEKADRRMYKHKKYNKKNKV